MDTPSPNYHLSYVFERFPSFTQTFCVREILELERLGIRPLIFSIHDTRRENIQHFPPELFDRVHTLPPADELVEVVKARKESNELPQGIVLTLREWGDRPDKLRVYEAAYIGQEMAQHSVEHAHSHFAGIGARACWWMRAFFGFSFSFTGHANDIFCEQDPTHTVKLSHLMDRASLVVTVSDYSVARLAEMFPKSRRKVRRVYNGLDLEPFTEAIGKTKSDPPLILGVGRLIEKKGFDDLIRACASLKQKGIAFRAQIVGDGPLKAELEALIKEVNTGERIELVGAKSQDEIIALLGEASLFALPCVTEKDGGMDNLPTVIMEAMAAGLPCVSTRLAGVPEMVIPGKTGSLVSERKPDQLAEAIAEILANPSEAKEMGQRGLERAGKLFSKSVTTKELARHLVQSCQLNFDPALVGSGTVTRADYAAQKRRRLHDAISRASKPRKRPLEHFHL
jgi:colanic acid/amylovoran biosynthesis glycosyltransferase